MAWFGLYNQAENTVPSLYWMNQWNDESVKTIRVLVPPKPLVRYLCWFHLQQKLKKRFSKWLLWQSGIWGTKVLPEANLFGSFFFFFSCGKYIYTGIVGDSGLQTSKPHPSSQHRRMPNTHSKAIGLHLWCYKDFGAKASIPPRSSFFKYSSRLNVFPSPLP